MQGAPSLSVLEGPASPSLATGDKQPDPAPVLQLAPTPGLEVAPAPVLQLYS